MKNRVAAFFALGALVLAGCSLGQKSTPSRFYVLTALPQATEPLPGFGGNPPNVGVTQIEIPGYLDRPQITYLLNDNEIRFNEFNRWGEPIGEGVTRVIRQNLTELLGAGKVASFPWMQPFPRQYMFNAVVTDFMAGEDGKARLSVIYRFADGKNQETYLVREATFVDDDDDSLYTDNAVAALSRTLGQFARAAAKDLVDLDREMAAKQADAAVEKSVEAEKQAMDAEEKAVQDLSNEASPSESRLSTERKPRFEF